MNNLDIYKQQINVIFSCLEKLKNSWTNQDNINFINNLNEYKEDVINFSNLIKDMTEEKQLGENQW